MDHDGTERTGAMTDIRHKIHDSLHELMVPIDTLVEMPDNPRHGNVDAISRSYSTFGQLKPIVVADNGDGTSTVMSGNHQLKAAKKLGWTHIAVTVMEGTEQEAIAFALVENRFGELGSVDKELLHEQIVDVYDIAPDLFDTVGWDDFEIAAMGTDLEETTSSLAASGAAGAYIPPVISDPTLAPTVTGLGESSRYNAPEGTDQKAAVTGGSTVTGQAGTKQAVFSYNIVFDNSDQMSRWWDFIKWLRSQPAYDGETITEKLVSFIDAHSEV
jgi:hypothetical protein